MIAGLLRRLMLGLLVLAAGCTRYEPLSLHGAASMRVEVEVYKGPLSVPVSNQLGQLAAVISDTVRAFSDWRDGAEALRSSNGCSGTQPVAGGRSEKATRDCDYLTSAIESSEHIIGAGCYILNNPVTMRTVGRAAYLPIKTCNRYYAEWSHIEIYRNSINDTLDQCKGKSFVPRGDPVSNPEDRNFLDPMKALICDKDLVQFAIDNMATIARMAAFRVAGSTLRYIPQDLSIRSAVISFSFIASEYGNQLQSRASALAKQLEDLPSPVFQPDGPTQQSIATEPHTADRSAAKLAVTKPAVAKPASAKDAVAAPVGSPLDQSTATDTASDASNKRQLDIRARLLPTGEYLRDASNTDFVHLFDYLDATSERGANTLAPADRARLMQRLTNDVYWEKVNEVYASGQGNVSMAFIKDDLGNWDLRSFDNDPSELLASYRAATNAALKSVVKLASKAVPGAAAVDAVGGAQKMFQLANQLATGDDASGASQAVGEVETLHARAEARLKARQAEFAARKAELDAERPDLDAAVANAKAALNSEKGTATEPLRQAEADNANAALALNKLRQGDLARDALEAARSIMADQLSIVAALQESAVPKASPTTIGVPKP